MIEIVSVLAGVLTIPSCTIRPGMCAVTGPNGAGKTTFLKLIAGILPPGTGKVRIDGSEPSECTIGWVGEYPDRNILFPRVYDELAGPLRFTWRSCQEIDQHVRRYADELGITHLLDRNMHDLSGGELILVSCAAACITSPDLLILDETDSHLDEQISHLLEGFIARAGIRYVIFSTHRPDRMARAGEMIRLVSGAIAEHLFLAEESGSPHWDHLDSPWFWRRLQHEISGGGT